jgi:CRAL/TRIO domain
MSIMPSVPGPDGMPEDRGVLRKLVSALAFENRGSNSRRGSRSHPVKVKKSKRSDNNTNGTRLKPRRRDCLGRPCDEDDTVDENESTSNNQLFMDGDHRHQFIEVDPSFVDIFYDAKDRESVEALLDEDLIPIGLEPDDSVMVESFEACIRGDGIDSPRSSRDDSSTLRHYQVPSECHDDGTSMAGSCSTLSVSDAPTTKETKAKPTKIDLPLRFLRAGKGDEVVGRRRFQETLQWRLENGIDNFLFEAWPHFELVKKHYPHFFHGRGRNGQPVFYEQPPKTDLRALRAGGVGLELLLKHYAMITEFQWQYVERDDFQRSCYIVDLAGIRMTDFVGECVDFVRQASTFTAAHYPERAGHVFVVNVPAWYVKRRLCSSPMYMHDLLTTSLSICCRFKIIWSVVKPMVDEVTLEKVHILRGQEEIFKALLEQIPIENIPREYGGESSYKLGEAPEEVLLCSLMRHNNEMAEGKACRYIKAGEPCKFCNFSYARHY